MEMMLAALTVEAETGASTRVKGLSMKFETTKSAMTAKTTFLKERRGLRGVKCILGRSPCELVTSAFALRASEVGDSYLHIASDARGLGATHGGNDRARNSQMSTACRNRKLRRMRPQSSCIETHESFTSKCLNCMPLRHASLTD